MTSMQELGRFPTPEEAAEAKLSPDRLLARQAIEELRYGKEHPFVPTEDMDIVWVLSAPGTAFTNSDSGSYAGDSSDRRVLEYGLHVVKEITALRLGKPVEEVTKEDVGTSGPILYYNGEDAATENNIYPQNQHLAEWAKQPDFPIPESNVVIDRIDVANTPGQIESIIKYIKQNGISGKIATVSIGAHDARVFRYLEKDRASFPEDVEFVSAPALQTHNPVGTTKRELDKVLIYSQKGDMAVDRYDQARYPK